MEERSTQDLERFDQTFEDWVAAFLRTRNLPSLMPQQLVAFRQQFDARIPSHIRELIGDGGADAIAFGQRVASDERAERRHVPPFNIATENTNRSTVPYEVDP